MPTLKELSQNPGPLREIDLAAWGIKTQGVGSATWRLWRKPWPMSRRIETLQRLTQAAGPEVTTTIAGLIVAVARAAEERLPWAESVGESFPTDLAGVVGGLARRFPDWYEEARGWLHDSVVVCQSGGLAGDQAQALDLLSDTEDQIDYLFPDGVSDFLMLAGVVALESLLPFDRSSAIRSGLGSLRTKIAGLPKLLSEMRSAAAEPGSPGSPTSPEAG